MNRFCEGTITDTCLVNCLKIVDLGDQYVLKTDRACKKIVLSNIANFDKGEIKKFLAIRKQQKTTSSQKVSEEISNTRRQGRFIDEILPSLEKELHHARQKTRHAGKVALR